MQLSIVILGSIFILCCAGFGNRVCKILRLRRGSVAAVGLLCLVLAPMEILVLPWLSINPAYLILLSIGIVLTGFHGDMVLSISAGFVAGIVAWLLHCALPNFAHTGLFVGGVSACVGRLLPDRRKGMLCPLVAPLFFGFLTMLEDWYLFDISMVCLGSQTQLDGQALGIFLYCIMAALPSAREKIENIQKINA